jgi:hypothetical protein
MDCFGRSAHKLAEMTTGKVSVPIGRIVGVPSLWPRPDGVLQQHELGVSRQLAHPANVRMARDSDTIRKRKRGGPVSPLHDSHYFHIDRSFPDSFHLHATSDTRAAACHNLIAGRRHGSVGLYVGCRSVLRNFASAVFVPLAIGP